MLSKVALHGRPWRAQLLLPSATPTLLFINAARTFIKMGYTSSVGRAPTLLRHSVLVDHTLP